MFFFSMISWYLEIRNKFSISFVLFSKKLKWIQKKDENVNVFILYFTSMKARGKIYIISYITGIMIHFRHGQIILKITLWWMMLSARIENLNTDSKKRLGTHFGSLENKMKTNVLVRTKAKNWRLSFSTWMRAHALRWEIRTAYETGGKIHRKLKCDLSEMNDYLWPRETLRY